MKKLNLAISSFLVMFAVLLYSQKVAANDLKTKKSMTKISSESKKLKTDLAILSKEHDSDPVMFAELEEERMLDAQIALSESFQRLLDEGMQSKNKKKWSRMVKKTLPKSVHTVLDKEMSGLSQIKTDRELEPWQSDHLADIADLLAKKQIEAALKPAGRRAIASQK